MRTAVFFALLAAIAANAPTEQQTVGDATALAAEEPSVLQGFHEALMHQLNVPGTQSQQKIAGIALLVGLVCLANGEVMLFQLVLVGSFITSALLLRNEVAATWGAGFDSTVSLVTSLEAGLVGTLIAFYAYDAVVLALGALVGFFIASSLEDFAVGRLGVDAATFDGETVAFAWYSIFTLGAFGLVAMNKHGKYLGMVTSFFGGALLATSALYFAHAESKWVDCLRLLLGGADAAPGQEPVFNPATNTTVWGTEVLVPGFSNFHIVGCALWAVSFLAGASFQYKTKQQAKARAAGVDASTFVFID